MLNTYESLSLVQPPIEVINTISEGSNAKIIELLEPVDFDSIINKIKHELYIILLHILYVRGFFMTVGQQL
ncbi:hypothetical protein F6I14_12270 [Staphylococcus epidermidis]|uniref:hypothetical protein n=1 Tax=Staphylococcus epidermidis TaxID=1282 RepID=UPI0007E4CCA3|nr:hypothetical protein [Staphylococcus epidermidis]KAA9271243.1 hypothetical protein F6I14_12270 [Staphylococcus epidermidis]MDH8942314.1 hypothetical protein [Staphylococcus epidermidis]MDH9662106.1 hypothetical protein [Staphylococcus epidermidis]MDH9674697.1 hypothetical protein [Staphylococcus epidermidis]